MSFNLESGKSKEINETPEVKVDSQQLSETEETAENFDDCSLNEVQDGKGNEVNAESLEEAEENYDDCEAKMAEMEEKNPELTEDDDDFNDCGKETDGQYVAEVTYTTDGEISQEEASAELQEAYSECDDPEDMQQLKENANENEHIEVHNAEVVERPENSEMGEEVTEEVTEEYEEAQQELDEAQENLEAQQQAAQEYQEDLENQINKHENEVPEGTENINYEASESTEETENSNEVEEATEDFDEVEESAEETEDSDEVKETTEEDEDSGEVREETEKSEDEETQETTDDESKKGEIEETAYADSEPLDKSHEETNDEKDTFEISDVRAETESAEEIEVDDLQDMDDDSKVETSKIDEENLSENVSQEVEAKTDAELGDETKKHIEEEVSNEINSEAENNEISAAETEEIIEEKKNEAVDSVKEIADELEDEKTEQLSEQSEQSLQERIDGAFEKEDVTASEINSLRDEHSAELQAKIEEKSTTETELKTKFDEVLSKEKGSDEYRQSLQEYNALQDKKSELDEQIATMEERQDLLDKKSIELREAQIQKGSAATLVGASMLQERYDQTYYDAKPDKAELASIREESRSIIKELSAEKDSIKQAMDAKMDEISEYVMSNNMGRYDTAHDLHYQQLSAEYNAMKENYDRIGYSIVKLDENNKAITAQLEGQESSHSKFGRYDVDDHGFIKGENFEQYIQDWEGYSSEHYKTEYYENAETQIISPSLVGGIRVSEYDVSNPNVFWSQHKQGGTEQSFSAIAKHIPEVQSRLENGESLSDLMQDEQVGTCAAIYFHPDSMPKVIKCGDYYEFQGNGRHRILATRNVGCDIPVKIIAERKITSNMEENDRAPDGIEDNTACETDSSPNPTVAEATRKSSIAAFFGGFFAHNKPDETFASVENVSNQPIDTLYPDSNKIEDDRSLEDRFAKIKDKSFSEFTERERTELINIAVENLKQKYKETIPESRFDEIKQNIKFIDKSTVMKELSVSEDEANYYLGWYSSSTDDIKINVSAENNVGALLATVDHEAMHMATQRKDGTYITGVKTNTTGIHYRNVGMNEGLTEMYSIRNIQELSPDYVSNSYTENVKLMERFESVFGKKELTDAYLTNNFEAIRNDYENHMGKGSFVNFCNLMDSMHNDYNAHIISSGRQKSIQLQQLINNYESEKKRRIT